MPESPAEATPDPSMRALVEYELELDPAHMLETCRAYLLMAANRAVGSDLRAKIAPSDLVQETMIAALAGFEQFEGTSERELLAWLTKILSFRVADAARRFRRQKADLGREVPIEIEAREIELSITSSDNSPSAIVVAQEEEDRLMAALSQMPAEDANLIRMRNWDQLTFEQIGQRLGLSESGVRKRWGEAIKELRRRLQ